MPKKISEKEALCLEDNLWVEAAIFQIHDNRRFDDHLSAAWEDEEEEEEERRETEVLVVKSTDDRSKSGQENQERGENELWLKLWNQSKEKQYLKIIWND